MANAYENGKPRIKKDGFVDLRCHISGIRQGKEPTEKGGRAALFPKSEVNRYNRLLKKGYSSKEALSRMGYN